MELTDFMNEAFYHDYLLAVEEELPVKVDMKSKVSDVILDVENEALALSGVSLNDLKWLIENRREETVRYIAKKNITYTEPEGGEDRIVNLPPQINFPIHHLIEYFLILKSPEKLVGYIRSIRIPSAKKYAKEIEKIFADVQAR